MASFSWASNFLIYFSLNLRGSGHFLCGSHFHLAASWQMRPDRVGHHGGDRHLRAQGGPQNTRKRIVVCRKGAKLCYILNLKIPGRSGKWIVLFSLWPVSHSMSSAHPACVFCSLPPLWVGSTMTSSCSSAPGQVTFTRLQDHLQLGQRTKVDTDRTGRIERLLKALHSCLLLSAATSRG